MNPKYVVRYGDIITERPEGQFSLPVILRKVWNAYHQKPDEPPAGFRHLPPGSDTSCYNRVGRFLATHSPSVTNDMVVAFYHLPGSTEHYVHAAIEMPDGKLVSEVKMPHKMRDENGYPIRQDMERSFVPVPEILTWLTSAPAQPA